MTQSDGKHHLQRMMFVWGDRVYKFKLNPQQYEIKHPQRSTVVKTQSKYVVEDFNSDVATITISGHTGVFKGRGFTDMVELSKLLTDYADTSPRYGSTPNTPINFYNLTDNEFYSCHLAPGGWSVTRDVASPLFYNYDINLIILGKVGAIANPGDLIDGEVTSTDGNKEKKTKSYNRYMGYSAGTVSASSSAGLLRLKSTMGVK